MKSGNFEKFIKCSTNLLIGKVPYRYIGIQSIGIMFPQLHTILHFRKNGSISKKIKLITTTVLLCQYVNIQVMPV